MGCGEIVRYTTRYGAERVNRIALIAATAPLPMKTPDNPDAIDLWPQSGASGAEQHADRL